MASNDPFIDILTVIDAESLRRDYGARPGSKDAPTFLGNDAGKYIYMLVKRSEANNIEAQPELSVAVKTGDNIRWRACSLTMNTTLSTLLYRVNVSAGAGFITAPVPNEASIKIPTPVIIDDQVKSFGTEPYVDFYFQATARSVGGVTYQLYIILTDNQGNPKGYYFWDPYLTITQS